MPKQLGPAPVQIMMPKRVLGPKDLPTKGIKYSANHLRRLWRRGEFPEPKHISKRRIVWDEATIDAWIAEKLSA
jgi:predicted DNA-binding transcriptional regulator AlpA